MNTDTMVLQLAATLLRATVLLALTAVLDLGVLRRRASAGARHLAWAVTTAAVLAIPLMSPLLPSVPLMSPAAQSAPARALHGLASRPGQAVHDHADLPASPTPGIADSVTTATPTDAVLSDVTVRELPWSVGLLAIYVVGVLLVTASIVRDRWRLARLLRRGVRMTDGHTAEAVRASGLRVRIVRIDDPLVPFTAGVLHPVIVVPRQFADWPAAKRAAILQHEMAHVSRRDCLTQTLAAIACAVYWPVPLMWWAAARLRLERELACDDRVVAGGASAVAYGEHLLDVARALSAAVPKLAVSAGFASQLESRLGALLDHRRNRSAPSRGLVLAATTGAFLAGATVGAVSPRTAGALEMVEPATAVPSPLAAPRPSAPLPASTGAPVVSDAAADRSARRHVTVPPATPVAAQPAPFAGTFRIRPAGRDQGTREQRMHVALMAPGLNTFYVGATRLRGLRPAQLSVENDSLAFSLRRDAGTFEFAGTVRRGQGEGRFVFRPDARFGDELRRRGIGTPTPEQQFSMARHEVELELVDEILRQGYATPTAEDLVGVGLTSVDLRFLREMDALGFRERDIGAMIRLYNVGVVPSLVRGLAALGYRRLRGDELALLANHGIDSAVAARANAHAGRRLPVVELARNGKQLAEGPVQAIVPARSRVRAEPPPSEEDAPIVDDTVVTGKWMLRRLRGGALRLDIDWDNVNQWERSVAAEELHGLPSDAFGPGAADARFRLTEDAGVFEFEGSFAQGRGAGRFSFVPNHGFADTLRALGVRGVGRIGVHQMKNLAFFDGSAAKVRTYMAAGLASLTFRDLMYLTIYKVPPEFVRDQLGSGTTKPAVREIVDRWITRRVYWRSAPPGSAFLMSPRP